MENSIAEQVQRTLDYTGKDRQIPEDPWFFTRLTGRLEKTKPSGIYRAEAGFLLRLRPALASALLILAAGAGILLGTFLSRSPSRDQQSGRAAMIEQFASENLLHEINGSRVEQILLLK